MAQLALQVLGMPRIQLDGAVVHIARRRAIACAVYLAVTGRAQSRDTLTTLFWPEETQQHARADLRRTLYWLHRAFGEDRLRVEHDAVQLIHDQNLWLDLEHFHRLLAVCQNHGHAAEDVCPVCLPSLAAAAALYRDDFLAGFTLPDSPDFDQWQFQQGESLRAELATTLAHLVRGYTAQQAWDQAIAYARRWLALDPSHEPVQRWLMQLYAWSGQHSAALRQYRDCVQVLAQELGAEPDAETQRLQRLIKRHQLPMPTLDQLHIMPSPPAQEKASPRAAANPLTGTDELRLLTVVCAGLQPLVAEEADLDQEVAATTHLLTLATTICAPYGGQVERVPGGDLLLLFGRHQIHEDDPERAVRVALALQAAAQTAGLSVQVGVNTGMVYCTQDDTPGVEDSRGTMMGSIVNLAVQLRSRAAIGQLLIGKATYRATRGSFAVTPLALPLMNAQTPLAVYHIHALYSHPAKARDIEGFPHPLIGLTEELAAMQAAFAKVQAGAGHLVLLSGPAGVGKSRLVSELKQDFRFLIADFRLDVAVTQSKTQNPKSKIIWLEGRCLAFAMTASYALFVDALRGYLSGGDSDSEQGLAARLVNLLQTLTSRGDLTTAQMDEMGPLLGRLLSLHFGSAWDDRLQQVNPQQVRSQTFQAVETLLATLAQQQTVVLVCEDLHWADALSLALLGRLIERLLQLPLLLVCVYRPEDAQAGEPLAAVAAQAAGAYTTAISLRELSTVQSSQLLTTLLAGAELPATTRDLILAAGQGNPFFLEEIVRALIERGLLDQHDGVWQVAPTLARVTTPESVQQVILSRVDQLTPAQKRLLQSAAVIGRLFRPRVLATLLPHEGKLDQLLAELTDQAFIDQERSLPEREYAFHHVLTQDAIYHALPERRRASLHQQVAEGLEQLYSADLEAYLEQLAYHYDHSGASHSAKAIEFLARAGEKARRAYLNDAALDYYARAARRLAEMPPTAAVQSWQLVVARGQGLIYLTTTHFTEAECYLRQAIDWAATLGVSPREQARLYGWLCRVLRSQSRIDEVVQVCEAGLALLGTDQTAPEAANLYGNIADVYNVKGDRQKFRAVIAQIIPFLPQVPCTGDTLMVYGHAVTLCLAQKQIAQALQWLALIEQGLEAGHELMPLIWAQMWVAAWIWEAIGDFNRSFSCYRRAIELCQQTGSDYELAWALGTVALHHYVSGELAKAEAVLQQSYAYKTRLGAPGEIMEDEDLLARLAYCRGDLSTATAMLEKTLALVQQSGFAFAQGAQKILLGQLYLAQGEPAKALSQFQNVVAESVPDPQGMTWIAGALAGIEAALANPLTFQTYCCQIQAQRPELPLAQWWLEPATPHVGVCTVALSIADAVATPLKSPRWVDPLGDCAWTAANALVIQAANHRDLWVNNVSAPRLLWSVAGDFAIQVVCRAAETDRPAIGGLLLWQDQENYLRLTWGEYGTTAVTLVGCIANVDQILGRGRLAHQGQVHLRLERRETQVRALCSADGQTWFCVGQICCTLADELAAGFHAIGKIDRTFYPGAYPAGTAIHFCQR